MIAALGAAALGRPRPPLCAVEITPFRPAGDLTYLLAVAQPDTLLAGPGPVRPTGAEGHWGRAQDDSLVFGQLFRIQEYGGAGAPTLDSALAKGTTLAKDTTLADDATREIVVVLWDYDADCKPTEWSGSARWAFPDSSLFLAAKLRDTASWVDGRPTFDGFFAGEMAYPFDALTQSVGFYIHLDSVGLPYGRRTDGLAAAEVYRLVDDLPKPCDWRERPVEATGALAVAKARHGALVARFPANVIVADHERWARGAFAVNENGDLTGMCGS